MNLFTTVSAGNIQIRSHLLQEKCRIHLIGDYHCTIDDERGEPFRQYSARMAQYEKLSMEQLKTEFDQAHQQDADAILLLGDIISFPSEAGVEELYCLMENSPVPVFFIAGNHDWHYEGTPGSDMAQRKEWIAKRLTRLYRGNDPMNYTVEIKGIKILMVDNSVYELMPSQLGFLKKELSDGKKAILACHIPLYLPGVERKVTSYGCGHPGWCAANDPYFEIERRVPWAEKGFSDTTFDFCKTVLESENILGIVAGHTHRYMLDIFQNKFQLVVDSHQGCTLELE